MKLLVLLGLLLQVAPPSSVQIVPERATLEVGQTQQFKAVSLNEEGVRLPASVVVWHLADRAVAKVDDSGVVTALAPGSVRLVAVIGGEPGYAQITVPVPKADRIVATLPESRVLVGTSMRLDVALHSSLAPAIAPRRQIRYASSNRRVASVDRSGKITGVQPGEALITVRSGALETEVPVTVAANPAVSYQITQNRFIVRQGDVVRFRIRALDANGNQVAGIYPEWSVDGHGATITNDGADGVFVAEEGPAFAVVATIGKNIERRVNIVIDPRTYNARLELIGRGAIRHHHSGDMWAFEGIDGRDYAYVGTFMYDWMKVFDVTDPENPLLTDSVQVDARRINDVKIHSSNRLAVLTREGASDRKNGIVLLDLSTPAHPSVLSEYTQTVTGGVHNVWIEKDLIYACHNGTNELHIIDISDPAQPSEVGRWGLDKRDKTLHDVIVQEGYAYLSYWDDGLVTLDVGAGTHGGTPKAPVFVSRFAYPTGHTHVAWRHGRYLFVGDEIWPAGYDVDRPLEARGYIHVLDMTDINTPVEVARYEVPEAGAHNVWVEGDRLFVGYYQGGVRVLDISGELRGDLYKQGREMAYLLTTDEETMVPNWPMAWGAQLFKGYIYTSDLNSGLWITRLVENIQLP